jgi:Fe-S cluster assembly ATP-binding protein
MFAIINLSVSIDETSIVRDVTLTIAPGTVHAIMGPNGSGKSTLAYALMGHPRYQVISGTVVFNNQDITAMPVDQRARAGIFLSFQHPYALPGVTVFAFLHEAYNACKNVKSSVKEFEIIIRTTMEQLAVDISFMHRALNDGFSGGEKKRFEILQLMILQPKIAILDEIDSGLDVDALKAIAAGIAIARKHNPHLMCILITHYQRILNYIVPDVVHVMHKGTLIKSGSAQLAHYIDTQGYDELCI